MNVFDKLAQKESEGYLTLGNPSPDAAYHDARMHAMKVMRNGHGFRKAKKEPMKGFDGLTRGERKRAAYRKFVEDYKNAISS